MKKSLSFIITITLIVSTLLSVNVWAKGYSTLPDLNHACKLTVDCSNVKEPAEYALYQVATLNKDAQLAYHSALENVSPSEEPMSAAETRQLANTLAAQVQAAVANGTMAPVYTFKSDKDGGSFEWSFENDPSKAGLYLLVAKVNGSGSVMPSLIALPNWDEEKNEWVYEEAVQPKYSSEDHPHPHSSQFKVNKVWKNGKPNDETTVTIQILKDGKPYGENDGKVVLNKDNNWSYSWTVQQEEEENASHWTVAEVAMDNAPEGFKLASIDSKGSGSGSAYVFTITNEKPGETPPTTPPPTGTTTTPPGGHTWHRRTTPPPTNTVSRKTTSSKHPLVTPKTGDTQAYWKYITIFALSGVVLITFGIQMMRKKKDEK